MAAEQNPMRMFDTYFHYAEEAERAERYPEAAKHKKAEDRKIVGDADVILFPDIHAGNIAYKFIVHTTEFKNACILTGTKAPAILTSRSDSAETKVNSIALAAVVAAYQKK